MINIKTDEQIKLITKSCEILAEVKQVVYDATVEGAKLIDIDALAEKEIRKRGATPAFKGYQGFPGTACISVNDVLIHGIPDDYVLKSGDIVSIDMGTIYKGYYSDSAFSKGIGHISKKDQRVMDVAKNAFYLALDAIKPGARFGDISAAIGDYVHSQNMFVPSEFTGHGVGIELHEDPNIPCSGIAGTGELIKDGMIIAIEPMILQGSEHSYIEDDGWTVRSASGKKTAHYEHTVLIRDGRGVILTGDI